MTRQKKHKKRVRDHQEKTGKRYTDALVDIQEGEQPFRDLKDIHGMSSADIAQAFLGYVKKPAEEIERLERRILPNLFRYFRDYDSVGALPKFGLKRKGNNDYEVVEVIEYSFVILAKKIQEVEQQIKSEYPDCECAFLASPSVASSLGIDAINIPHREVYVVPLSNVPVRMKRILLRYDWEDIEPEVRPRQRASYVRENKEIGLTQEQRNMWLAHSWSRPINHREKVEQNAKDTDLENVEPFDPRNMEHVVDNEIFFDGALPDEEFQQLYEETRAKALASQLYKKAKADVSEATEFASPYSEEDLEGMMETYDCEKVVFPKPRP